MMITTNNKENNNMIDRQQLLDNMAIALYTALVAGYGENTYFKKCKVVDSSKTTKKLGIKIDDISNINLESISAKLSFSIGNVLTEYAPKDFEFTTIRNDSILTNTNDFLGLSLGLIMLDDNSTVIEIEFVLPEVNK